MKVRATVQNIGRIGTWTEDWEIPRDGDCPEDIILAWNKNLRVGELPRELVSYTVIVEREVLFFSSHEYITVDLNRIGEILDLEILEDFPETQKFFNAAVLGSMCNLAMPNCHHDFAVIVLAGEGQRLGIDADLPLTEAESCSECDEGEPDDMTWENGGWTCGKCGAVQ